MFKKMRLTMVRKGLIVVKQGTKRLDQMLQK